MSKVNSYLTIQKTLNNELQKKATFKDILFLLFCIVFPFFTVSVVINLFIFSALGMIYIQFGVIQLFPDNYFISEISTQTKSKIYKK